MSSVRIILAHLPLIIDYVFSPAQVTILRNWKTPMDMDILLVQGESGKIIAVVCRKAYFLEGEEK